MKGETDGLLNETCFRFFFGVAEKVCQVWNEVERRVEADRLRPLLSIKFGGYLYLYQKATSGTSRSARKSISEDLPKVAGMTDSWSSVIDLQTSV